MKKSCVIIAVFSVVLYVIAGEKQQFPEVQATYDEQYKNFNDAFSQWFEDTDDIWLVLGNRGAKNYYRERFSKNWIFWDYNSSSDSVGISGDFLNPKNWRQVSKMLPKKVNYIAVDFNDLVDFSKRNEIIKASTDVLNSDGVFCVEDEYDNRKKRFKHFSDKDFDELSQDFDIEYAYWDGYISALPYTSYQSANRRSDIYKGLETMILRLASADKKEKKKMLPYITSDLSAKSSSVNKNKVLIKKLVRNIVDSTQLRQLIKKYENALEEETHINESIEKEKKEIENLKKDIDNYAKMVGVTSNLSDKFGDLSKNINALNKGADYLNDVQRRKNFSFMNKMSKFLNKTKDNFQGLQEKLDKKKKELAEHEQYLSALQGQLDMIKSEIKETSDEILKYNDEIFAKFGRDKYLERYVEYKKTELKDIISDSKDADEEFWDEYDSFWNSISDTEIMAKELEKSWSPDIIFQNLVPIEKIRSDAEKKIDDTSRILILFIKKQ